MGCMWDVTFNELAPSDNDTNYIKNLLLQNVVVSAALLQRSLVRGTGVDALQPLVDGRVFPLCQASARHRHLQGEGHHDVCATETRAGKERLRLEVRLNHGEIGGKIGHDVEVVDRRTDARRNGPDEEGRPRHDHAKNQLHQQRRHHGPFGKVHVVAIVEQVLLPSRPERGREVVDEIFRDESALCQDAPVCADDGALAQRVDIFQLAVRLAVWPTLVYLDLIGSAHFFQQPQDALAPRVLQVVEYDACIACGWS